MVSSSVFLSSIIRARGKRYRFVFGRDLFYDYIGQIERRVPEERPDLDYRYGIGCEQCQRALYRVIPNFDYVGLRDTFPRRNELIVIAGYLEQTVNRTDPQVTVIITQDSIASHPGQRLVYRLYGVVLY